MSHELVTDVGNVRLVASSLVLPGEPDSESDYIVSAREIDGHVPSGSIRVAKPGGAKAALDAAASDRWVLDHR